MAYARHNRPVRVHLEPEKLYQNPFSVPNVRQDSRSVECMPTLPVIHPIFSHCSLRLLYDKVTTTS